MNQEYLKDAAPAILEASSEAIVTIDRDMMIKGCNSQFLLLLGIDHEDEIENTPINRLFPAYNFSFAPGHNDTLFQASELKRPNGLSSNVLIKVISIGNEESGLKTILIQDPDAIRRVIDHLDYIESFDIETGLLNRHRGTVEFEQLQTSDLFGGCILVRTKSDKTTPTQKSGDTLKNIASQLNRLVPQNLSCRYSETELLFIFATEQMPTQNAYDDVLTKLQGLYPIDSHYDIWLSYQEWAGAAQDLQTFITQLRHQLIELHAPDAARKIFDSKVASTRVVFLRTMEAALHNNEFEFFIQPQISSEDKQVVGGELLIRWRPTHDDLIPPSQFVDFLEQGEFGQTFLNWSIEEACQILQNVRHELDQWVPLSLNVASNYFSRETLVDPLKECLTRHNIPPQNLEIEITERILAENPQEVMDTLNALRDFGCPAAIDDFGTGYSFLSYLRKFPLDRLKIDRVFVVNLAENEEDRLITVAIASLAHVLGLEIVAEGIETDTQAGFLKNIGCKYFQGYLTGKPMPVNEFIAFCKNAQSEESEDWTREAPSNAPVANKSRKVNWKKSFSTDVVSVDNEHRILIDYLNDTTDRYLADPDSVDLVETLEVLALETAEHFEHEESVMRNIGYSRYEIHREKHKWLIADISKRKAELIQNPNKANFDEIVQYLKYWLLRHLISEDTHIMRHINSHNSKD